MNADMNMRDEMALSAMAALIYRGPMPGILAAPREVPEYAAAVASAAYVFADAMLAARKPKER